MKDLPTLKWTAEPESFYTLIMTGMINSHVNRIFLILIANHIDPDAPSRQAPVNREFLHWLVANIPGDQVAKGDTIAEYIGSGPPKDSGLHRYVFLVYKQGAEQKFDEPFRSNT